MDRDKQYKIEMEKLRKDHKRNEPSYETYDTRSETHKAVSVATGAYYAEMIPKSVLVHLINNYVLRYDMPFLFSRWGTLTKDLTVSEKRTLFRIIIEKKGQFEKYYEPFMRPPNVQQEDRDLYHEVKKEMMEKIALAKKNDKQTTQGTLIKELPDEYLAESERADYSSSAELRAEFEQLTKRPESPKDSKIVALGVNHGLTAKHGELQQPTFYLIGKNPPYSLGGGPESKEILKRAIRAANELGKVTFAITPDRGLQIRVKLPLAQYKNPR